MKISVDWIRDYIELPSDLSISQLMTDLTTTTVEVEAAHDLSVSLRGIVVARVLRLLPVNTSDRYVIATCDVGSGQTVSALLAAGDLREGNHVPVARQYAEPTAQW